MSVRYADIPDFFAHSPGAAAMNCLEMDSVSPSSEFSCAQGGVAVVGIRTE